MRDFIAGVLLLASIFVFFASIFAIVKPLPKLKLPTRKSAVQGLVVALGLLVATIIVIPKDVQTDASGNLNEVKSESKKGTVLASNDKISEVNVTKETKFASVKVDLDEMWSADDLPVHAAIVVEDAGKAIKNGASEISPEIERVRFWFTGPTIDQYGNEDRGSLIQFEIKTEDLKLVNYGKIAPQSLLEFAYEISTNFRAREGVYAYCDENIATNPRFCAEVRSKRM